MQEPPTPEDYSRVILHIDEDCFYAQVEMKRLSIPRETPCAVQQCEGLIAVNYPARARGVTRHMRVKEAKKVCPELVLVHVETIGAEGRDSGAADAGPPPDHRLAPAAVIEKASIDEVYMDVTAMVDKELQDRNHGHVSSDAFSWGSVVVGGPLDPSSEVERRLAEGARIACRLRGKMLEELGFTSSAGISTNKLLSKIGSAMNKPNQQTIIPPPARWPWSCRTCRWGSCAALAGSWASSWRRLGAPQWGRSRRFPMPPWCPTSGQNGR